MRFKRPPIVDTGKQLSLTTSDIQTNPLNPRRLFDEAPMRELQESIREHGVLVPLTVYMPPGGDRHLILDGERRYRCCIELEAETGSDMRIPCNVVMPPNPVANIVYMFSIHKLRLDWELMPTAISLGKLIAELHEDPSDRELRTITGLSQAQVDRCRILMLFPEDLQGLSLDQDAKTRIPANFWFEMYGVLQLAQTHLPEVVARYGGLFGVARRFTEKYRAGFIRSVIDFRRVKIAFSAGSEHQLPKAVQQLEKAITDIATPLTELFWDLSSSARDVTNLTDALQSLRTQLERVAPDLVADVEALRAELLELHKRLGRFIEELPQLPEGAPQLPPSPE